MQTQVNWHSVFNLFQKYFRPQCDEAVLVAHCIHLLMKGSLALCHEELKTTHKDMMWLPEVSDCTIVSYLKSNFYLYII